MSNIIEFKKSVAQTLQAILNGDEAEPEKLDPRPDDVKEISKRLANVSDMHRMVGESQFPAKACKVVDLLLDYLHADYKKIYSELINHPWVMEQADMLKKDN